MSHDQAGGDNDQDDTDGTPADSPDDLGIASDIEALVAAVEAGADDLFDDDLMDDEELAGLQEIAGGPEEPGDAGAAHRSVEDAGPESIGALELDEGDFEELELEPEPLSLYLDIDGTLVEVDQDKFVIGRVRKMCDFAIVDVNVSRQHCAIERRGDGYYVVDYESINGVKLDGQRIDQYRVADGDVLELAGHTIGVSFGPPGSMNEADLSDDGVESEPVSAAEMVVPGPTHASSEIEVQTTGPYDPVPTQAPGSESDTTPPRGRVTEIPTQAPAAPVQSHRPTLVADVNPDMPSPAAQTFEQRVEARLEHLSQQVAYLQQCVDSLLAGFGQIQDVASIARVIRERLGDKRGSSQS